MPDTVNRFFQGYIGASGTNITNVCPAGTNYTVKHMVFSNMSASGTVVIGFALNNPAILSNYMIPSGTLLNFGEWLETSDIYVLNPGDSIFAVATANNTVSVNANG